MSRVRRATFTLPRRSKRERAPDVALVAAVVQRLAVLLAAGVTPANAWGYLNEGELPTRIAAYVARGVSVPDAIVECLTGVPRVEATAWRGLATAWAVALDAGAPLAATLREFASSLRSLAQAQREIKVALATPAATAKMVMALPAVGLLFGLALGFNTFATLTTTPVGIGCLVVGGLLLLGAARWNNRLVSAAQPTDLTPGLGFDLMAIAVSGGGSLDRARSTVRRAMDAYGPGDPQPAGSSTTTRVPLATHPATHLSAHAATHPATHASSDASADGVEAVLELSARAGVPAAELLRSEAEEARRSARSEVQERAASLAVKLMLPLGLLVLPSFMVVGVLPLLVSVFSSTNIGF